MANQLDVLTSNLQQYVVAPLNAFGIGGFLFDIETEQTAHLSADITDHYTEDNKALQDHIAIKPKKITLKGFIGEVVYRGSQGSDSTFLQQAVQKLTELTGYLPQLSAAATQLISNENGLNVSSVSLTSASDIYGLVKNLINASGDEQNQQRAYNYFKALMEEGILMGIQTPWEFMTNMAIENIIAIQAENSIFISDFAVTFKQIRIAQTQTVTQTALNPAAALTTTPDPVLATTAAQQYAPPVTQGLVPGIDLSQLQPGVPAPSIATIPQLVNSKIFQDSTVTQ